MSGELIKWEDAAEQLGLAVEKRIAATARKAAEALYEGLLYDTQDYLRDNLNFNLSAELSLAKRGEAEAKARADQSAELVSELVERGEGLLKAYRVLIDHIGDDEFDIAAEHPASWATMMEATLAKAKAGGA